MWSVEENVCVTKRFAQYKNRYRPFPHLRCSKIDNSYRIQRPLKAVQRRILAITGMLVVVGIGFGVSRDRVGQGGSSKRDAAAAAGSKRDVGGVQAEIKQDA